MYLRLDINGKTVMNTAQRTFRENECIWYDKHRICSVKNTANNQFTISVQELYGDDIDDKGGNKGGDV